MNWAWTLLFHALFIYYMIQNKSHAGQVYYYNKERNAAIRGYLLIGFAVFLFDAYMILLTPVVSSTNFTDLGESEE